MNPRIALVVFDGGVSGKACLVDGETECPLPMPLFTSANDAAAFLEFAEEMGFFVSSMSHESLERLRTLWMQEASHARKD